jgi:YD repeat-containing protein
MFYSHFIKTRIFKSIAIFLIVSFVFVEFGFAQEDYSAHEQHADYGGFIPYAQAQRLMEADAATVDKLNAIENARSRFTVKTADNQDLLYVDDVIAAAKDAEGNIVFDPVFDDENNLQDGRVILADGTVQFYQDGKLVKAYTTYGTFLSYSDDGLITKETFPDGAESFYVYEKDEHGTIIKVSVQSGAAAATYDKDGKPINIIKADGTEYCYENGVLRSIASADGTIYRYTPIVEDGKTKSVLSEIAYADGSVLTVTDHTITALQCTPSDFAVNTTNVTGSINTYYNAEINKDVLTIESPNNSSFGVKYTQQASFTSVFDNLSLAVKSTNNTYFYIQVNVKGADGQNYTIYYQAKTGQDSISGNKLYRKLGTHLLSGNWVDLALDISGDLQKAFNTSLASIKQLYLRGNMEAADIKAYNLAVSCANSFTVPLTGWRIYTSKTGEYFEETDLETGAAIIRLSSGFNTSFGVRYPVNNYLGCPNEKLSLSVKAGRDFLLKYKILAADGKYYTIVYRPGSRASYVSGTTAYYYLGNDLLNNAWHDITRNLRSDLQQAFGVDFLFATDSFICGGDISVRDMTLSQGLGYDAPLFVTYGDSAEVEEALSIEGKLLTITNGLIGSAHDVLRNTSTLFSYETSAGVLGGFSLTTNGITTAYDATGTLTGILLPDGTGINFTADFTIENFFTANNIVLDDFLLDTQGIGENKTHLPNGAVCVYEDGELKQITTPGGLIYVFSKSEQDGKIFFIASLDRETTPSRLLTDEAPSSLIYDEGRILVCIVQENGVTTSLVDGKIVSKMAADGSITSYSYTYNDAGDLTGIKVEDAVSVTWYDGQGVAFKACAKGSDGAPDVTSEYAYGKIRKVFSGETLIYEYEYEFVDGSEVVVVKDIENSVTKRYCDGRLLTQVNQDGIVTRYEYDAQGRISKAEVVLNGKVLHSYQYSYSGDFTAILDEDGTLRTYSPDKKLYRLKTKEGFVYEYAYLDDGEEISIPEGSGIDPQSVYSSLAQPSSIATLNQIELLTGEIVRLGGTLPSSLVLPDGTLLRDLTFDESRQLIKAVVADGEYDIVLLFNNGAVTEKDYPDGSALYYDENGRIIKAETFEGLTYEYTYADDGTLQEITVQDGDAVVKFDGEGNQIASFHTDMSQLPSQAGWTYYGDTGEGSVASIVDGNAVINTTNGGATNRAYYYAKQYFLDNARGWKVSFRFTLDPKTASTDPKVEFNINDGARRLRMKFYPNAIIIKAPSDDNPVSLEYPVSDGFHTYTVEGKGTDFCCI